MRHKGQMELREGGVELEDNSGQVSILLLQPVLCN